MTTKTTSNLPQLSSPPSLSTAYRGRDAEGYQRPYSAPEASAAIAAIMDRVDFKSLCQSVDDGFRTWKKDSVLLFGANDRYLESKIAYDFLETKRTNMRMVSLDARVGHSPCEDFPDAVVDKMVAFLEGKLQSSFDANK